MPAAPKAVPNPRRAAPAQKTAPNPRRVAPKRGAPDAEPEAPFEPEPNLEPEPGLPAAVPVVAEAGRRGLLVPLDLFRARVGGEVALRKILGALSVTEKVHAGRPRGMACTVRRAHAIVREGGRDWLLIPRVKGPAFLRARTRAGAALLDGVRAAADALPLPRRLAAERCEIEDPLYEYQEAAVSYLLGADGPLGEAAVAAHRGVAYLQMDTGLGKTRLACALVARRGEPALVVVPTKDIGDQWIDEFAEIFPGLVVGFYHNPPKGSRRRPPGPATHDVVIVIINTFREKGPEFLEGYGTVVLDEAHEYHSTHNCRALWLSQTRAVLGLSATPEERPDGLDRYVALHLGPAIRAEAIPGFDVGAVNFRGEARVIEYAGHPDHCETATTPSGTMSAIGTIGNIIKDPYRLRAVAAEVVALYRLHETAAPEELARLGLGPRPASAATPKHPEGEVRRHGVFVFAEHREYLPALRTAINVLLRPTEQDDLVAPELDEAAAGRARSGLQVSLLRGGVSRDTVVRARRARAHIVLTTYGFSRRGISLVDMTAIVEATSRRNGGRQLLGRMLRRGSDESILRQVRDFVDVRTGLKSQITDRRKIYTEKKYPISKVCVTWEDFPEAEPEQRTLPAAVPAGLDDDLADMTMDDLLAMALGGDGPLVMALGGDGPRVQALGAALVMAGGGGPLVQAALVDDISDILGF
jgi:hypothetical protein